MRRTAPLPTLATAAVLAALPAVAGEEAEDAFVPILIEVPSGQPVEYVEVIRDVRSVRGLSWRFQFVAPEIGRKTGSVDFETAALDMDHLCQNFAIPRLPLMGPRPREIVISLSDQPLDFGVVDPEITQFFEVYSVSEDTCIWEAY